jgi:hypothetical protein
LTAFIGASRGRISFENASSEWPASDREVRGRYEFKNTGIDDSSIFLALKPLTICKKLCRRSCHIPGKRSLQYDRLRNDRGNDADDMNPIPTSKSLWGKTIKKFGWLY